ncbi:NAD(P)-dependent dehydrogenase, short-chain alcohol dehydrogenase family [Pseudomonas citronellolis]|uniref:NAD(P)-dependent dehydrogenase, short-chain alcohol dehydrogenase family n=1 Tax=Pseudomonas citronellolis TaxID=53408 RepID=A0AAQ1HN62_9PSED|nr:SDR family NAD(P)-dependent oxidoreductase [Pseudomonas citronellolis]MCP1603111.1 NAD(P)-dependent dehydrogenase (short-subunit alcohol dehydrogenase family) [Pseudomonas citronellolis]MCP1654169.1 NAD(P)-dependent dehydrogenase (short-subunit alcohol dehydrogenase family) [Pseudomonas citronellolis]MCP1720934.1 NAD(P)-dependent dehydrogenase (short-subunit alcohol dehydrogenase family) [Pseudomonas citronellolis]TGC21480.1 NAD(P)-dependent oxidoreductase [Pseudomonas citronellolis]SFC9430
MTKGQRLAGKVAIVTGIGSGIGQGCALLFAREGARVVGCDIDAAAAERTLAMAREQGLELLSLHPCDLTEPQDARRLVEFAVASHGGIDVLVNAAAFGAFAWIEDMDYQSQWRRTLSGELDLVFLLCQAAWPHLKRRGGSIVNFASANAWMALEGSPALAHCAGKGGVLAMTRQLALEGGPHRIRANSISPGLIETNATREHLARDPAFLQAALDKQMLRQRIGQPEDVAWAALYLASDESAWVTGSDLKVDGGATAG